MATILSIIPYNFYPPVGGGALRCFNILKEMARMHTVYVVTTQPEGSFTSVNGYTLPENVVIKSTSRIHIPDSASGIYMKTMNAISYRVKKRIIRGQANSYFLASYPIITSLIRELKFDIVYYENLEAVGELSALIKRLSPGSVHLYDAHNVDSDLWAQQAKALQDNRLLSYANCALQQEKQLHKSVDCFFCCSKEDREKLIGLNKANIPGIVVSNGVDTSKKPYDEDALKYSKKEIIFCGSLNYQPNMEGLQWFYSDVFPTLKSELPGLVLTVVGQNASVDYYKAFIEDKNVNFVGTVPDVNPYYYRASVAIVPLLSGSGTRLKILEAMSLGNPVVSTTIGAEGIRYEDGKHLLIADHPQAFVAQILALLTNGQKFDSIRRNARKLVKQQYDWQVIGESINTQIKSLLKEKDGGR
ncbi:glycosyltransferase family 4 protein [Pontibacter liquoris]|uniref:glycosyltransferase family 4 protein n=1 Tax=Pontibacter liquoris TaxID=2905677 RepID=UPI001FA76749|nr:glycosyltransferase family 4 protein [Pontibacter liquoris]